MIEIKTLNDYVEWMANSMHKQLTEEQIREITNRLINSKRYNDMLRELEIWILNAEDKK